MCFHDLSEQVSFQSCDRLQPGNETNIHQDSSDSIQFQNHVDLFSYMSTIVNKIYYPWTNSNWQLFFWGGIQFLRGNLPKIWSNSDQLFHNKVTAQTTLVAEQFYATKTTWRYLPIHSIPRTSFSVLFLLPRVKNDLKEKRFDDADHIVE